MTVCQIEGCERLVIARGWCSMHYQRWQARRDPLVVHRAPGQRKLRGPDHPLWSETPDYGNAHRRVVRTRGRARSHLCWGCGEVKADEWAYMHTDPDELTCCRRGVVYSGNPTHYEPRCRSCHRSMDRRRKAA